MICSDSIVAFASPSSLAILYDDEPAVLADGLATTGAA